MPGTHASANSHNDDVIRPSKSANVATFAIANTPDNVARNGSGARPRACNTMTNGGPLVPIVVDNTPDTTPAATSTAGRDRRKRNPLAKIAVNTNTLTANAIRNASSLTCRATTIPTGIATNAGTTIRPTVGRSMSPRWRNATVVADTRPKTAATATVSRTVKTVDINGTANNAKPKPAKVCTAPARNTAPSTTTNPAAVTGAG